MKKKVAILIAGIVVVILVMLLRNNTPDDNEVLATDQISQEFHSTDTENDTLEDEYSVVEIENDEYTEVEVQEDSTAERVTSYVYAAADTDVYAEMSTESEILGTVKVNDKLKTYGSVDGWYVIDYDGQDGFIQAQFTSPAQVSDSESTITLNQDNGKTAISENTTGTESTTQTTPEEKNPSVPQQAENNTGGSNQSNSNSNTFSDAELDALLKELDSSGLHGVNDSYTGYETTVEPAPEHVWTEEELAEIEYLKQNSEIH